MATKSACAFQCALVRIMVKILFCLVAENVYDTDCQCIYLNLSRSLYAIIKLYKNH